METLSCYDLIRDVRQRIEDKAKFVDFESSIKVEVEDWSEEASWPIKLGLFTYAYLTKRGETRWLIGHLSSDPVRGGDITAIRVKSYNNKLDDNALEKLFREGVEPRGLYDKKEYDLKHSVVYGTKEGQIHTKWGSMRKCLKNLPKQTSKEGNITYGKKSVKILEKTIKKALYAKA